MTSGLGSNTVTGFAVSGSTIYAATLCGLSVSTNGGANWTNYTMTDGLGNDEVLGVAVSGSTICGRCLVGARPIEQKKGADKGIDGEPELGDTGFEPVTSTV